MRTTTRVPGQYRPLSDVEVRAGLAHLPGWHGDCRRIARTVNPRDLWSLLERIAAVEEDLDHHTVVDLDAGTVTFAVWTHDRDCVTPTDLELAGRINELIAES